MSRYPPPSHDTSGGDNHEDGGTNSNEEDDKIPLPVAMWDFDHCDPKKCSGKKLARLRMIQVLRVGQRFRGIIMRWVVGW